MVLLNILYGMLTTMVLQILVTSILLLVGPSLPSNNMPEMHPNVDVVLIRTGTLKMYE
jgi:hypothetical protein